MSLFSTLRRGAVALLATSVWAQSFPSPSGPSDDVKGAPYKLTVDGRLPIFLSGYIQTRFTDQRGTTNPFQVKRLRFIADAQLTDKIDLYAQVDPTLSQGVLLDAYLQFKWHREARVRVGQFKVPFSGESLAADERTIPIERSKVVNGFSPGRDNSAQGRDIGILVSGNIGAESRPSLEYTAAFLNGSGIYNVQSNRQKAASGRLIFHPIHDASVGGDYYQGKEPPVASTLLVIKQRQDLEAGYKHGKFVSWSEYLWGHDGALHRSGGYGLIAFKFTPHWEGFARAQEFNLLHGKGANISRMYDSGANYYFTRLIRLQANYGVEKRPKGGDLGSVFLAQIQAEF